MITPISLYNTFDYAVVLSTAIVARWRMVYFVMRYLQQWYTYTYMLNTAVDRDYINVPCMTICIRLTSLRSSSHPLLGDTAFWVYIFMYIVCIYISSLEALTQCPTVRRSLKHCSQTKRHTCAHVYNSIKYIMNIYT